MNKLLTRKKEINLYLTFKNKYALINCEYFLIS